MSIKLYVDHFGPNQTLALTKNKLSVSYNLVQLGRFNEHSSPVFTSGKYMIVLWATEPPSMTFIDVRNEPETIQEILNSSEFANKKTQLVSMLEMHNATYDSTKNYIELVLGVPPNATPLSEADR
jgi:hypothetical protein